MLGDVIYEGVVEPAWIDVNDHMNVAYYVLAFDLAIDELWRRIGIDRDYVSDRQMSTFAVESHIEYLREMREGAPMTITTQLLAYDGKRIHQFLRMYHRDEGFLAATSEWMNLHVDLSERRVAPWPDDIRANIDRFANEQALLEAPDRAGRRIRIGEPLFAIYPAEGAAT